MATLVAFAPSLRNGFAMDDACAARTPLTAQVQPLGDYFATNYWHGAGEVSELYRPITILSFALTNALRRGGGDPEQEALPHHAINLLLHLAAVLAVFALVRALGGTPLMANAAAAVFGLHAVHSEVVATVVGRAELLAFVFGAGAALAHLCALRVRPLAAFGLRAAAAAALFLAFGSKESALAWAPFLAVLGWAADARRDAFRHVALAAAVAALPLAAFFLLRAQMLAALPAPVPAVEFVVNPVAHLDATTRVCTATMLWGFGLLKTLLPLPCHADYGAAAVTLANSLLDLRFVAAAMALLVTLGIGVVCARRRSLVSVAVAAFFGFSLLTSNLPFAIGTIFGERFYYAPSLGLAFAAAALARWPRRSGAIALGAWLAISAVIVVPRNFVWQDDDTLFLHEAQAGTRSVRMLVCAAVVHEARGQNNDAERLLRDVLALEPEYALAWNNLGALRLAAADLDGASEALRRGFAARWGQRTSRPLLLRTWQAVQEARRAAGLGPEAPPGPLR